VIDDVITERKAWLSNAVAELRPLFNCAGYKVPENVRVTCARLGRRTSGCHYSPSWSSNGNHEIFINCSIRSAHEVISTLVHEMVHASAANTGHGKDFKKIAFAVGLIGPMQNTDAGPVLSRWIKKFVKRWGPYPLAQSSDMFPADQFARRHLLTRSEKWLVRLGGQLASARATAARMPEMPGSQLDKAVAEVKEIIGVWEQVLLQMEWAQK